jgi:hypothetical protein
MCRSGHLLPACGATAVDPIQAVPWAMCIRQLLPEPAIPVFKPRGHVAINLGAEMRGVNSRPCCHIGQLARKLSKYFTLAGPKPVHVCPKLLLCLRIDNCL